jgi:lantibiotic transport system permease protein
MNKISCHFADQLKLNFKTFVALLGIVSIQYWLGLRFRNFIVPIGIGLGLLVASMILSPWEHIDKVPYAFPFLTFYSSTSAAKTELTGPLLQNHELNSIGYFVFFTILAFLDMKYRKERG